MRYSTFKALITIASLHGLALSQAEANSIEWGSEAFGTGLTSTGGSVTGFTFELGTFGSFIPDESNLPLWRDSWKLLDSTSYNPTTKVFTDTATLVYDLGSSTWSPSSADVTPPSNQFAEGEQVYIWVYNNTNMDATTEWGVYTRKNSTDPLNPDWVLPTGPGSQTALPQFMFTPDVNNTPFGGTPTSTGLGEFTPPSSSFSFQTHSFIPEPSSIFLLGIACSMGLVRRRK
jgi:hypothetical protein